MNYKKSYKKSYKSICLFLFFALLCLCLFGGLKVNASQNDLNRYYITMPIHDTNNIYLMQIPNNANVIEDDSHNYALIKVSFDDNTERDFLTCRRIGMSGFSLYGYYGTNLQTTITAYDFLGFKVYRDSDGRCFLTLYIMQYDTTNASLQITSTPMANVDIGTYYNNKYIGINGIAYGSFYFGGNDLNQTEAVYYINNFLTPNISDIVEGASAQAYNRGYGSGYDAGYSDGQDTITPFDRFWSILTGIFSSVGSVLSINLFPGVPLGIFILIPLFFGAIGLILWIWRRN